MIDGSDHPWYPETHEHIDRVAARHVSYRVVRVLLVHGCCLAGEGVRQRGPQGHEGDGGYLILQIDDTSEDGGEISDHDDEQADHGEGSHEAGPAASHAR